jgi:hypothetical protein
MQRPRPLARAPRQYSFCGLQLGRARSARTGPRSRAPIVLTFFRCQLAVRYIVLFYSLLLQIQRWL